MKLELSQVKGRNLLDDLELIRGLNELNVNVYEHPLAAEYCLNVLSQATPFWLNEYRIEKSRADAAEQRELVLRSALETVINRCSKSPAYTAGAYAYYYAYRAINGTDEHVCFR